MLNITHFAEFLIIWNFEKINFSADMYRLSNVRVYRWLEFLATQHLRILHGKKQTMCVWYKLMQNISDCFSMYTNSLNTNVFRSGAIFQTRQLAIIL